MLKLRDDIHNLEKEVHKISKRLDDDKKTSNENE
jgi:hypothetical protein